jgi:uncharacterized membrane protein YccC
MVKKSAPLPRLMSHGFRTDRVAAALQRPFQTLAQADEHVVEELQQRREHDLSAQEAVRDHLGAPAALAGHVVFDDTVRPDVVDDGGADVLVQLVEVGPKPRRGW